MVRASAIRSLKEPSARPVVHAAIGDPAHLVRTTAIEALTDLGDASAAASVRARLADDDEWPDVRIAAMGFAAVVCDQAAVDPLILLVRRGLAADATTEDRGMAARAVPVLRALGERNEGRLLDAAGESGAPPASRRTPAEAPRYPSCHPAPSHKVESGPSTLLRSVR
jgi:HEAT repeat protein